MMVVAFAVFDDDLLFDDHALGFGAFLHDDDFFASVSWWPGVGITARHAGPDQREQEWVDESLHACTSLRCSAARHEPNRFRCSVTVTQLVGHSYGSAGLDLASRGSMTTAAHALSADWVSPLSGVRVLLVEDDPDSRELLEVVLTRAGMMVDSVSSVAEAFEVLTENRPDVIVSDIGMPFENGYSFLRNLRQVLLEEGTSIPAVAVTGFTRPEDRERAFAAGFSAHLAKPIDPEQVLRVLAELTRH